MESHRGVAGGITIWYVFNTFITYWYHRFQHRFSIAWRMLHQVHHGVPRVDIPSALIAHPLDVIVSTTLSILVTAFYSGSIRVRSPSSVSSSSSSRWFPTGTCGHRTGLAISFNGPRNTFYTINARCMQATIPTGHCGTRFSAPIVRR